MSEKPRIVFMGTPEFARLSLEGCLEVGNVVAVVTQPDRPSGRGQKVSFSPVKALAVERGIPVLQPARIKGTPFASELAAYAPQVCVVTAYGRILPGDVLAVPPQGCVNVHASLLPRFRGAAPIQWAIAEGDAKTGVCLMKMDEGMDTGPVIACAEEPIRADDTSATLHDRLARLGKALLVEKLPGYLSGALVPRAQPSEGVVMARMIDKADGAFDFSRPAAVLERRLRAFTPWPGGFTYLQGLRLAIRSVRVEAGRGAPGEILAAGPAGIEVACGEGSLRLLELQPEGKRVMTAAEFLAGRPLAVGARPFSTEPAT